MVLNRQRASMESVMLRGVHIQLPLRRAEYYMHQQLIDLEIIALYRQRVAMPMLAKNFTAAAICFRHCE